MEAIFVVLGIIGLFITRWFAEHQPALEAPAPEYDDPFGEYSEPRRVMCDPFTANDWFAFMDLAAFVAESYVSDMSPQFVGEWCEDRDAIHEQTYQWG